MQIFGEQGLPFASSENIVVKSYFRTLLEANESLLPLLFVASQANRMLSMYPPFWVEIRRNCSGAHYQGSKLITDVSWETAPARLTWWLLRRLLLSSRALQQLLLLLLRRETGRWWGNIGPPAPQLLTIFQTAAKSFETAAKSFKTAAKMLSYSCKRQLAEKQKDKNFFSLLYREECLILN